MTIPTIATPTRLPFLVDHLVDRHGFDRHDPDLACQVTCEYLHENDHAATPGSVPHSHLAPEERSFSVVLAYTVRATTLTNAEAAMLAATPTGALDAIAATLLRGTVHDDGGAEALRVNERTPR